MTTVGPYRIFDADVSKWVARSSFTVDGIHYHRDFANLVARRMIELIDDGRPGDIDAWAQMCHSLPPTEQELDDYVRLGIPPRYPRNFPR